jgi:hypothetical protein
MLTNFVNCIINFLIVRYYNCYYINSVNQLFILSCRNLHVILNFPKIYLNISMILKYDLSMLYQSTSDEISMSYYINKKNYF